ncbi:TFIID-31kDa-domain-containing protein [Dothidotthia symphoricarpi CBS 119687]|uniref:TFIID-31kDa-domain-containing protein n=1 Tax=Dothidotthia symphoricarpi CBS 119687 TaxID=1392245 RepID=A0A6A6A8I5_9PLEO|nr:TFIID-31kDa-domain-containing protein [Dothidotthia symphoricarpi CBS 119687]KAF2127866.1 TFIID-31kDa-domain-containing protein [Dothidotthia symphoricarpi CBS 119687]
MGVGTMLGLLTLRELLLQNASDEHSVGVDRAAKKTENITTQEGEKQTGDDGEAPVLKKTIQSLLVQPYRRAAPSPVIAQPPPAFNFATRLTPTSKYTTPTRALRHNPQPTAMASPAADMPNGISTPPATTTNGANPSPPTTQASQQASQPASQPNGASTSTSAPTLFPSTSLTDPGTSKRPRDARLLHLVLAHMGVTAYTERVPLQLLDFAYRYTSGVLSDALAYEPPVPNISTGGKKKREEVDEGVSLNALRTAVGGRAQAQFQGVLPKEYMAEMALERNKIALPRVEREFGVRLPPERYCFTGVGWGMRGEWEEEVEGDGDDDEEMDLGREFDEPVDFGVGGPVGGEAVEADTAMGGMEEEEADDDEFEEAMGLRPENNA